MTSQRDIQPDQVMADHRLDQVTPDLLVLLDLDQDQDHDHGPGNTVT